MTWSLHERIGLRRDKLCDKIVTQGATAVLHRAQRLLETEGLLQEKIKAGATIGELVNVDEAFGRRSRIKNKALEHG